MLQDITEVEHSVWSQAKSLGIVARSFWVALTVGSILTMVNQYESIIGNSTVQWMLLILTFDIPYFLNTVSGVWVLNRVREQQDTLPDSGENKNNIDERDEIIEDLEKLSEQVLNNAARVNVVSGKRAEFVEDVLVLSTQSAEEICEVEHLAERIHSSTSEVVSRFIDSMNHVQKLFEEITSTQSSK